MQKIYFVNDTIIGIYLLKWYVPTLEFYKKRGVMRLGGGAIAMAQASTPSLELD